VPRADLVIYNIGELVTFAGGPTAKPTAERAGILREAAVAVRAGRIVDIGPSSIVRARYTASVWVDAGGRLATPGLVDMHTHPLFAGSREDEFEAKLSGVSYSEILARGGGIYRTIRATRSASREELLRLLVERLYKMLWGGTTIVEAKTGYALDPRLELEHLRIILEASRLTPQLVVPTLLAHVPPREEDRRGYIEDFKRAIGEAARLGLARYFDVFCDRGAFTPEESRELLEAAHEAGLRLRMHADQLEYLGCSRLVADLPLDSVDHLEVMPPENASILASRGAVAGLLPTSIMAMMQQVRPPVEALRRAGVPLALGSDYNPNNMTPLVQTALQVAPYVLGLTPLEALAAATVNAAASLRLSEVAGRVARGCRADLVVWDAENYRWLGYEWGYNLALHVVAGGVPVVLDGRPLLRPPRVSGRSP
jgi:imidazolonepropionase